MAEGIKFENLQELANGDTITGSAYFYLLLTSGAADSSVTLTIGSNSVVLKALQNESASLPTCIKLGSGVSAAVALSGLGARAWAVHEVE